MLRTTGKALATVSVLAMVTAGVVPAALAQDTLQPETAPAGVQPDIAESVSAVVNDDIISSYDLVQRMRLLILTSRIQPTQENLPQIQAEALRTLIEERLQIQELRRVEKENKTSIVLSDKDLTQEIDGLITEDYKMTPDQFWGILAQQGIGRETYREQMRAEVSWRQYMQGRYGSRLRIGRDQIAAFQQRLNEAAAKPSYQIAEIYIDSARVGGIQVAVQGAQQLIDQLQQGAPFDAVARQFSASATAAGGGDVGWVSAGEMPPQVDAALEQLRPGQLSAPIVTDDGVYVIYLREKRAGASATLVTLKQAALAVPADATQDQITAATATLEQVRAANPTCADLETKAATIPGVMAGDLGEAEVSSLAPGFAEAAATTPENQLSAPIRTQGGLHLVMVCGKRQSGGAQLTAQQIENRLFGQQLTLISRRVLRDLRMTATIETR